MISVTVANLVNPGQSVPAQTISIDGGIIAQVEPARGSTDAHIAVPGFIDMHTHGGAGHDIMDGRSEDFEAIARHHLRNGTTAFLGSTLTAPIGQLAELMQKLRAYLPANHERSTSGLESELIGAHQEGPWISRSRAGAQNVEHIVEPDAGAGAFVREFSDVIRMVTFSYQHVGADRFLEALTELGIIAACGHDETTDVQILEAFDHGLSHITHLYSMSGSFRRVDGRKHLGSLEMALMTPGISVEVIADDHHITEYFWRFIRHNKSVDDIIIVSDSMRWAGMPSDPGHVIHMGGMDVIVDGGVAWRADRSAFAGSISSMHDMLRRLVREWNVDIRDAVRMTSWNQAKALGIDNRVGSIEPGKEADLVLLDEELEIVGVIKGGNSVERA